MAQSQTFVVRLEGADAPENLVTLLAVAASPGAVFAIGADGLLTLGAEDREIVLADSAALVAASGLSAPALARALNDDEALLLTLADAAGLVPLASIDPAFQADFLDAAGARLDEGLIAAVDTGTGLSGLDPLGGLGGSDGARVGSDANDGTLLSHLAPVASLANYFSVDLELKTFANLFGRVNAGVGPDLQHLPPLPDEDYARGIDPTVFRVGTGDAPVGRPAPPVLDLDTYEGTEDTPITGDLAENDTLPNPGATFSVGTPPPDNGTLTINPDGTFEFVPDPNFSGTVEFTYTVTDPASGTVTDQTGTFEIAPVADPVAASAATTPVLEDVATPFGANVTYALVDTDGSEAVASVTITGVPEGAIIDWRLAPGGTVTAVPGGYEIEGDEAAIRATLDTFAVTPPADSDTSFTLDVAIVSREPDGSTATATTTHTIDVTGVVDAPTVTGSTTTTPEDRPVPLAGLVAAELTDRDGSETIAVTISGVPAGASLTAGTDLGGGVWSLDPAELADIAFIPPADFDGPIGLTLTATTTETATGETATVDAPISIDVEAVADAPNVTGGSFTTAEDTAISLATLGGALGGALTDTDGSETLTFRIEGLPAGATPSAGAVQPDGSLLLTPAELATLSVTPPVNFHGTVPLKLVAIATEGANGDVAETATSFEIVVTAVADTPALTVQPATIGEDATLALGPLITMASIDTDGSESVSLVAITDVPAGSAPAYTLVGTATVTPIPGGYEITGDAADIRATLDTFALTPPTHVGDDFALQIAVTVTDADGSTATTGAPLPVDVVPVADAPLVAGGDFATDEDVAVTLTGLDAALVDLDGSESILHRADRRPDRRGFRWCRH